MSQHSGDESCTETWKQVSFSDYDIATELNLLVSPLYQVSIHSTDDVLPSFALGVIHRRTCEKIKDKVDVKGTLWLTLNP